MQVVCLYELPDGTRWCEHTYLYDLNDLCITARKASRDRSWGRDLIGAQGLMPMSCPRRTHACRLARRGRYRG